jgi:putative acetyltransferase
MMTCGKINIDVRLASSTDLPVLRAIYADAVDALGPAAYTAVQVDVWKGFAARPDFEAFILDHHTYIALLDGEPVGFCGIDDAGHIASVYVRPERCGRGIGTALLRRVLRRHPAPCSGRYYAEASVFSLHLFERCGFSRSGPEQVVRDGVVFERFPVERFLQVCGEVR